MAISINCLLSIDGARCCSRCILISALPLAGVKSGSGLRVEGSTPFAVIALTRSAMKIAFSPYDFMRIMPHLRLITHMLLATPT